MNRLFIALLMVFCFQTSIAQVSEAPQSDSVPAEIHEWLNEHLNQADVKFLQAYDHPVFLKEIRSKSSAISRVTTAKPVLLVALSTREMN